MTLGIALATAVALAALGWQIYTWRVNRRDARARDIPSLKIIPETRSWVGEWPTIKADDAEDLVVLFRLVNETAYDVTVEQISISSSDVSTEVTRYAAHLSLVRKGLAPPTGDEDWAFADVEIDRWDGDLATFGGPRGMIESLRGNSPARIDWQLPVVLAAKQGRILRIAFARKARRVEWFPAAEVSVTVGLSDRSTFHSPVVIGVWHGRPLSFWSPALPPRGYALGTFEGKPLRPYWRWVARSKVAMARLRRRNGGVRPSAEGDFVAPPKAPGAR